MTIKNYELYLAAKPVVVAGTLGDTTEYTSNYDIPEATCYRLSYNASDSGTLSYAHVRHNGTGADKCKIMVFSNDGNTRIAISEEISTSTNDWVVTTSKLGGSVVAATAYWVAVIAGPGNFDIRRTTTGTRTVYYKADSYTTPMTTLGSGWSQTASRDYSVYIEIE